MLVGRLALGSGRCSPACRVLVAESWSADWGGSSTWALLRARSADQQGRSWSVHIGLPPGQRDSLALTGRKQNSLARYEEFKVYQEKRSFCLLVNTPKGVRV